MRALVEGSWRPSSSAKTLQGWGPTPVVEGAREEPANAGQHHEGYLGHPGILFQERASLLHRHQGDSTWPYLASRLIPLIKLLFHFPPLAGCDSREELAWPDQRGVHHDHQG